MEREETVALIQIDVIFLKNAVLTSQLPAQCHSSHRHPCDAADAPPLLATVTMTTAGIVIFLLFFGVPAPIAAVAAAVVDEKGKNDEEG